ncbi:hypothetical protein HY642_03200 [Candidatus Woesearchaeota archaeon]|nr:hypothetical protein [Candidatus Woesearchaeota archaeon]
MKPLIASWMMILIIGLPIYAAQVMAASLQVNVVGQDNMAGYARQNDRLKIDALVGLPEEASLDFGQFQMTVAGRFYPITECNTTTARNYKCLFEYPLIGAQQETLLFNLTNDDRQPLASTSKTVVVDALGPDVKRVTVQPNVSSSNTVTVSYRAEDYASQNGNTNDCTGVQKLIFTVGNQVVNDKELGARGQCVKEGSFQFTTQATGDVSVCAKALDFFNQSGATQCATFTVDKSPPNILATSLAVVDKDGNPVTFLTSAGLDVDVRITIAGTDVNPDTVTADFSKISPGASPGQRYSDVAIAPNGTTFTWQDIAVSTVQQCSIEFTAADMAGNENKKAVTCSLKIDDTGPKVSAIAAQVADPDTGLPLIGRNATLKAVIVEDGAGLRKKNVFLDAGQLGAGNMQALECSKESQWQCTWKVAPRVASGTYRVVIGPPSADDIGNQFTRFEQQVKVDVDPPRIQRMRNVSILHGTFDYGDKIVKGDTVEWTFDVDGAIAGVVNLGAVGGQNVTLADCGNDTASKQCKFSTTIARSGPFRTRLLFDFYDLAGNKASFPYDLQVFGVLNDTAPDFWTHTIRCSPRALDRSTTNLINQKVYCSIYLTTSASNAQPIAMELSKSACTGDTSGFVQDMELFNNAQGSTNPYLGITIATGEFKINQFSFTCPLRIQTMVGDSFTQFPEEEPITVTMNFYNLPAGELGKEVDAKIKDAKKKAGGAWDAVGTLKNIFDWANKICTLRSAIWNAINTVQGVVAFFGVLGDAGVPQADELYRALCPKTKAAEEKNTLDEIDGVLRKFCEVINCRGATAFQDKEGKDLTALESIGTALGGGVGLGPWASGSEAGGAYSKELGYNVGTPRVNIKDSLIWSTLSFCLPGIIYNLDKYRQIQCRYAVCLQQEVKEKGLPLQVCQDEKAYMTCNFMYNQLFNSIPWISLYNYWISTIKEIISNPGAALAAILGIACPDFCTEGKLNSPGDLCVLGKLASMIGRTIDDVKSIMDEGFWTVSDSWCEQMENLDKKKETKDEDGETAPSAGVGE